MTSAKGLFVGIVLGALLIGFHSPAWAADKDEKKSGGESAGGKKGKNAKKGKKAEGEGGEKKAAPDEGGTEGGTEGAK